MMSYKYDILKHVIEADSLGLQCIERERLEELTGATRRQMAQRLRRLEDAGLVEMCDTRCYITMDGRNEWQRAKDAPYVAQSTSWRDEALSGIRSDGRQSNIEMGVLPRRELLTVGPMDDNLEHIMEIAVLTSKLDMDAQDVIERITAGIICECNKCGAYKLREGRCNCEKTTNKG